MENFENDRVKWQQREADLYNQIRSFSAANGEPRTPRRRSITSNSLNGGNLQQFGSSLGNICEFFFAMVIREWNSVLVILTLFSRGISSKPYSINVNPSCQWTRCKQRITKARCD